MKSNCSGLCAASILLTVGLTILAASCAKRNAATKVPPAPVPTIVEHPTEGTPLQWTEVATPYPSSNITSVGSVFWVCGANEMITSSSDGGKTWNLRHFKPDGRALWNIAFLNNKIGHAAGKGGLLLSTVDGGVTWKTLNLGDDVTMFSFADANNGIAVLGGDSEIPSYVPSWGGPSASDGHVKLTHDGGNRWQEIPSLDSDELKPFSKVLAVAALDASRYLMIRRQPNIEDVFLSTSDNGRSWKVVHQRNDDTNRELTRSLFVHDEEYWAFGMELLNRQQGGGYGSPLVMHSADGEHWTHGVHGPTEFGGCNHEGCYMWDGAAEDLYGAHERYWNTPQDLSLSTRWAIAGNSICTVSSILECGPAIAAERPQPAGRRGDFNAKSPR